VIGETLFLSNDEDLTAIVQPAIQNAIARGYAEAIKQYFARFPVR
jgi:N-acetylmuramoyl-L-alanine amidase